MGNLVRMLAAHQAKATFLFSLGPDHTGWALRRALRPGFFSKVSRTSVVEHYGLKTLMYGTLLPGPDIGKHCAAQLRAVRDAGFECGIHTWDHILWQDNVAKRNAAWTINMMRKAANRYEQVFGTAPHTHGAAGWQMNVSAFVEHDTAGYRLCLRRPRHARRARRHGRSRRKARTACATATPSCNASNCPPPCPPWTNCWAAKSTAN